MPVPAARSVEDILEMIDEDSVIIAPDHHVVDAIRARVRESMEGRRAYTLERFLMDRYGSGLIDRSDCLDHIEEEYDEHTASLVSDIIDCWHSNGSFEACNQYGFDKTVLEAFETVRTDTVFSKMEDVTITDDITVIDPDRLTPLQQAVLPEDAKMVSSVQKQETTFPSFDIFDARNDLLAAITTIIDQYGAGKTGIVVGQGSTIDRQIRARLRSRGIPIQDDQPVPSEVRRIITLLDQSTRPGQLSIGDIFGTVPFDLPTRQWYRDLNACDTGPCRQALELLRAIEEATLLEAFDLLEEHGLAIPDQCRQIIHDSEISDDMVSRSVIEQFREAIDAHAWNRSHGESVKIIDPSVTSHLDRAVTLHVGLDDAWSDITIRPWDDAEQQYEQRRKQVLSLLQSGDRQFYLVEDQHGDDPVTPCRFLRDELDIDRFSEHDHTRVSMPGRDRSSFAAGRDITDRERPQTISQSDLGSLVTCPRDYLMGKLVPERERIWYRRGTLLHDFAEFYTVNPSIVEDQGIDEFLTIIMDELDPFLDERQRPVTRTRIRHGLDRIMKFLDDLETGVIGIDAYTDMEWADNIFAEKLGRSVRSDRTEQYFSDPSIGISGVIDLIPRKDALIDYKTGSKRSAKNVVTSAHPELYEEDPDFQVIMYLCEHRSHLPDEPLSFTFFHIFDAIEDRMRGEDDLEDHKTTIQYHPRYFEDALTTEALFEALKGDVSESHARRKILERMGLEAFTTFIESHTVPDCFEKEALLDSEFHDDLYEYAKDDIGEYKYVENGCAKLIKQMVDIRTTRLFKDDLDRFESFVQDWLEHLHEWNQDRFPLQDPDLDAIDNRDLVLTGEYR